MAGLGTVLSRRGAASAEDYFLGGGGVPTALIVFSVLATTQSAATFLGGPDTGFRSDLTYLASFGGAVVAAVLVGKLLLPRFYAARVTTVYELLGRAYGDGAMRAAGGVYLLGRLLANGARLYMAALAVAMILFTNTDPGSVVVATLAITLTGLLFTVSGGLRSVIASDVLQFAIYALIALAILAALFVTLDLPLPVLVEALRNGPGGQDKLALIDTSFRLDDPFTVPAILTGVTLLYLGNFGLDQDTTQRLLAARDARTASRALVVAAVLSIPLVFVFLSIGQLLYVFYERADLTGLTPREAEVSSVTVFMHYILSELPAGLRGAAATGVLAAAVSTLNSGLNSMSSVAISDFYAPLTDRRDERHLLRAGRVAMIAFAFALFGVALLCFVWQRASDTPLLTLALQVMVFAYAGLIGVYAAAVFTRRGSAASIVAALAVGFATVLLGEPALGGPLGMPGGYTNLAFPWTLCIGALAAFAVAMLGRDRLDAPQSVKQAGSNA